MTTTPATPDRVEPQSANLYRLLPAGLAVSAALHLLLLVPFAPGFLRLLPGSLTVVLLDTMLWAVLLVPLLGAVSKRAAWYDPLVYFFTYLFISVVTAVPMLLQNPDYVFRYMGFAGNNFSELSGQERLAYVVWAEIVFLLFASIVLWVNRRGYRAEDLAPSFPSAVARRTAVTVFGVVALIGAAAFAYQNSFQTYYDRLLNLSQTAVVPEGAARFVLVQLLAVFAVSLFLVALLAPRNGGTRFLRARELALIVVAVLASLLPILPSGARLDLLFAIAVPIFVLPYFGIHIRWSYALVLGLLSLLIIGQVTMLRVLPFFQTEGGQVMIAPLSVASYVGGNPDVPAFLLHMDRIFNVALVLRQVDSVGHFVWGSTLVANWDAIGADFVQRLGGLRTYQPLLEANEYVDVWRFGFKTGFYPVPPSVAGELYMQAGFIALAPLAALFGGIVWLLRRLCFSVGGFFARWAVVLLTFRFLTLSVTQLSVIAPFIFWTLLPLTFLYAVTYVAVRMATEAAERSRPLADRRMPERART